MMRRCIVISLICITVSLAVTAQENNLEIITTENADRLVEIARLGRGWAQKIACSPDGRLLAVSATTGVYLHDVGEPDAEPLHLPHDYDFYRDSGEVIFSPDGMRLARVGPEISTLWDVSRSEVIAAAPTLKESSSVDFRTPFRFTDRKTLAIHVLEDTIQIVDVDTEDVVYEIDTHEPDAYYIFSPDASKVVVQSVGLDRQIRVWDLAQGEELYTYSLPDRLTSSILWSPDGRYVSIWNEDILHVFDGQDDDTWQISEGSNFSSGPRIWSPDSRYIAARTDDYWLRVYSAETGEVISQKRLNPRYLVFSPDSTRIISEAFIEGDALVDWSLQMDQVRSVPYAEAGGGYLIDLELCLDGQILAVADFDNRIHLFNLNTWEQSGILRYSGVAHAVSFSLDNRVLAAGSATAVPLTLAGWDGGIWLWDIASFSRIDELKAHRTRVRGLDFSADGQYLVSAADWYDDALLWNTDTGEVVARLNVSGEGKGIDAVPLIDAFFVPGQSRIGVHPSDEPIVRWWTPDVEIDTSNQPPTGLVSRSASISNNGNLYATAGRDSGVFEINSGERLLSFGERFESITSTVFNPFDTLIAVGRITDHTGFVDTWSLETEAQQSSTLVHEDTTVWGGNHIWVAFSPDGQILLAAGSNQILLIDTENSEEITKLAVGDRAEILSLAFSPDGRLIATGMGDGTIRLWGVPSQ